MGAYHVVVRCGSHHFTLHQLHTNFALTLLHINVTTISHQLHTNLTLHRFTCIHLVPLGLTWFHMVSLVLLGLDRIRLDSFGPTYIHLDSREKERRLAPEWEGKLQGITLEVLTRIRLGNRTACAARNACMDPAPSTAKPSRWRQQYDQDH